MNKFEGLRDTIITWAMLIALVVFLCKQSKAAEFDTVDHAIADATAKVQAKFERNVEYATAIISMGDGYRLASIVRGDKDSFELSVKLAQGEHIAALFHTHPGTSNVEIFSEGDVEMADKLGVPSYILASNHIRKYTPAASVKYHLRAWSKGYVSDGEVVT